eukprot:CAMPEP_0194267050 /NCGR_PEP_ID=MMETSP0169-20130528/1726_1 /TAXON_ID=218684 /ORGANISM="Corethron pennatum, Strain L29A3" /LENGTH=300 /DNA_ID=CAMNT_0039007853 /DNA_START=162 /DNA_END=1061 /DNA_ORIENTATION=+
MKTRIAIPFCDKQERDHDRSPPRNHANWQSSPRWKSRVFGNRFYNRGTIVCILFTVGTFFTTLTISRPTPGFVLNSSEDILSIKKNEVESAVLTTQIQLSHATQSNRYPEEYSFAKKYLNEHFSSERNNNVLSFGASEGLEAITLATMYLDDSKSTIYGVDLHQASLDKGYQNIANQKEPIEEGKIVFFNGNDMNITEYGPYSAIFANSVLCHYQSKHTQASDVLSHFPFSVFEDMLIYLDSSLKIGGLLAIVNTNYNFWESKISQRYKPASKCPGNFVQKVNRTTGKYTTNNDELACVW